MNIGHLIASNFFGGPERQVFEHLKLLNQRGQFQGTAFSYLEGRDTAPLLERCKDSGIPGYPIQTSGSYSFHQVVELEQYLADLNIDLLCVHGYRSLVLGLLARRKQKIPIIGFSRGWTKDNFKVQLFNWVDRFSLRFVDQIVAVSRGQQQSLLRYPFGYPHISVVHNCINTDPYEDSCDVLKIKEELGISTSATIIGSVGRLSPEKGHRDLLEAFSLVSKKNDNVLLVLVGDGVCADSLKSQAVSLGLMDKVKFLGFRTDVNHIMRILDLFVLPSEQEGLPNALLEAFAAKKPAVATAVGGVPEVIEEGKSGYLVPPLRPDLFAEAIIKCLESPEMMKTMGYTGYQKIKSEFTFERQTDALQKLYLKILNTNGNTSVR